LSSDYTIMDYDDTKWQEVCQLFKDVFGKELDKDYFLWKNYRNPIGSSVMKIAVQNEKAVGFNAHWKMRMNFMDDVIYAGQSIDAMVHKEHRRKGIFESMVLDTLEVLKEEGFQLRFNFPNEAAYQASLRRINIRKVCNVPQYIKILKGKETLRMFTSNSIVRGLGGLMLDLWVSINGIKPRVKYNYNIVEIDHFDDMFDSLWERVKDDYPIAVERSSKYLNWRYGFRNNGYKTYAAYKDDELVGYMVTALEQKKDKPGLILGHIADLICVREHKDAVLYLINEAERQMKHAGACAVSCWMIKEWFYAKELERAGFIQMRAPAVLAVLPLGEKAKAAGEALYDHKNWYITIGDSDYI